ncbi:MAG TPA: NADH-quinone oxidoreductase subunit L [Fibrobacteres bacterium]|nr:NADH-quinone oxidoreductase subunit L [Fibrobacterota bacterium]
MNVFRLLALPAVPAASALILALFGCLLPYNAIGVIAAVAAGISFVVALTMLPWGLLGSANSVSLDLGPWLSTDAFHAGLKLRADSVGLCMVLLVTFFGFLITVYSVGYMRHDREQSRFFASLNLFVASMLTLVLSDNLALIFLGWEGVGLCSYLLIGHYWNESGVPLAAFRAFFVNRIGDLLFILGVFIVFMSFGTLSLSELTAQGSALIVGHERAAVAAALLLLGGAFAKSAQAPLHVWLADAMAGPTPVSALIHAATMVTAGIYLVMRLDWLYAGVPQARLVIGLCALVTLIVGAFLALTQTDIKKILAYSTLSNLALMFLALSAGSSHAAMQHLFGHAFFKALLFLSAGSVILAAHHEQDVRKLQGVLKSLPITRIAFWVGCLGGAGLVPYFSAGFFTKEAVLESLRASSLDGFHLHISGNALYAIVLTVESLSALYLFRLLGYLSGGHMESHGHGKPHETGIVIPVVLGILTLAAPVFAVFSSGPGLLHWITGGPVEIEAIRWGHVLPGLIANLVLAAGCFAVFSNARRRESVLHMLDGLRLGNVGPLSHKFYFDAVYAVVIVLPLRILAWTMRLVFETIFTGVLHVFEWIGAGLSLLLRQLQTGQAHRYAAFILLATAIAAWFLLRG